MIPFAGEGLFCPDPAVENDPVYDRVPVQVADDAFHGFLLVPDFLGSNRHADEQDRPAKDSSYQSACNSSGFVDSDGRLQFYIYAAFFLFTGNRKYIDAGLFKSFGCQHCFG